MAEGLRRLLHRRRAARRRRRGARRYRRRRRGRLARPQHRHHARPAGRRRRPARQLEHLLGLRSQARLRLQPVHRRRRGRPRRTSALALSTTPETWPSFWPDQPTWIDPATGRGRLERVLRPRPVPGRPRDLLLGRRPKRPRDHRGLRLPVLPGGLAPARARRHGPRNEGPRPPVEPVPRRGRHLLALRDHQHEHDDLPPRRRRPHRRHARRRRRRLPGRPRLLRPGQPHRLLVGQRQLGQRGPARRLRRLRLPRKPWRRQQRHRRRRRRRPHDGPRHRRDHRAPLRPARPRRCEQRLRPERLRAAHAQRRRPPHPHRRSRRACARSSTSATARRRSSPRAGATPSAPATMLQETADHDPGPARRCDRHREEPHRRGPRRAHRRGCQPPLRAPRPEPPGRDRDPPRPPLRRLRRLRQCDPGPRRRRGRTPSRRASSTR